MDTRKLTHQHLDSKYESSVAYYYARYANELNYELLPDEVIHQSKRSLLDTIAVAIAAYGDSGPNACEKLIEELGGEPESTVFGSGLQTSAPNAALVNGVLVRHLDYNDTGGGGHNSDAIPGILAIAERENATPEEFIAAVVISYELGARVRDSLEDAAGSTPYGIIGDFRAGLTMPPSLGKLMGLSTHQIANAIGCCASRNFPLAILDGDYEEYHNTKDLRFSSISHDAILSCILAQNGFTGPINIIEGDGGINEGLFDGQMDTDAMIRFNEWKILETAHKLLCVNHSTQGHLLATLAIVEENDLEPDDIKSVRISVGERTVRHTASAPKMYPRNTETANHSAHYATAHVIKERSMGPESHNTEKFEDPVILSLYDKIVVEEHPDLPSYSRVGKSEITTKNGKTFEKEVTPPGMGKDPLGDQTPEGMRDVEDISDEQLEMKFKESANKYMDENEMQKVIDNVWNLETLDNMSHLTKLLNFTRG